MSIVVCDLCGKGPSVANNVSHAQNKTKRVVFPNIQKFGKLATCTTCRKTLTKRGLDPQRVSRG